MAPLTLPRIAVFDRSANMTEFAPVGIFRTDPDNRYALGMLLACLVLSQVVSYSKARADAGGLRTPGGLMERADRLLVLGIAAIAAEVSDEPMVLAWGLGVLGLLSAVTVVQRILAVRSQARAVQA